MKQAQIILRFLFPTNQDSTETVHPTVGAFNYPTTGFESRFPLDRLCLFPTRANVRRISELLRQIANFIIVISLIQTQSLRRSFCWLWPFYRNACQRRLYQFHVMTIGSIQHQSNRNPSPFTQKTAFNASFGSIRRVCPAFFPRLKALCSSFHPSIARTSQSLSSRHTPSAPRPKAFQKLLLFAIPENAGALWNYCTDLWHSRRSTGNQFATQTRSQSSHGDYPPEACDIPEDEASHKVRRARSFAKVHPQSSNQDTSSLSSSFSMFPPELRFLCSGDFTKFLCLLG